jgi:hypothetical protein|nr:MAG TPA: hypothetical protein [Caudoviricetes sp.]
MQVDLFPKPPRGDFATTRQVLDGATSTYCAKARDLLDRAGGDAIGAISLLMLAADQRKATAGQAAEPSLSEQALAQTVRDQRDTIDALTSERDKFEKWWRDAVHEATNLNADLAQREVDVEQITRLQSILCAATATAYGRARMYSDDLHALPIGTVVRDEADQAWTRIDDEDGGVWATPTGEDTLSSADLAAGSSVYLAWVADK